MSNNLEFQRRLIVETNKQREREGAMLAGAKQFADDLNKARNKDAAEFLKELQDMKSLPLEARRTAIMQACITKLYNVGYREAASFAKQQMEEGA